MTLPTSTSPDSSPEIAGYAIVEQLYQGARTAVYRAVQTTTQRPVVIKVLRRDYPSFGELVQFRNQYTITKNLPIPGIVQPLSLEPIGNSYALVMEDYGGVSLGKYVQRQSLELTEVLAIALQIADILHNLCQHRVVHKDIKPANILIHPESKQVKLIDFSIASLLPKETQEIQSPNILEGTLAYLAPEQTGRMNRGIDYRADFYALGVTLYQLLTETLPFASSDLLELLHCHIAKMPVPANQVNPGVPAMMAAMITKLMAKNAEDRYQSALGLKYDLEWCLTQWKATGVIPEFELGQRDLSDRFLIPEKLYGRETEVAELLFAFERVASGSSELMLVAGFSGIGKTVVVNEVHKPIVRQRGYFIKGKFDQFNRNIPLSAFVQVLRDLMRQLLCESDEQLAQWRTQILAALGENGQVMIEVIPELEQIIGEQPSVVELSGSAAQNRFNLLFQKFIAVLTTAEHPLVIFLDDLQWADLASLQLIKLLMNDNGYLLMLGAYRDNEVSPTHPFILTVAELKKTQAIVNTITLIPLAFDDTNHLVADTLSCSRELAQPLSELIDRKTQGNPFFTTQFLKVLHEDGYISFNRDRRYWECDIVQVNTLTLTSDVVEFMALQLQKLPNATQQVLKLAACVGNQFDLATLAIVSEQSPTDAATALWKALQEGLILPTSQVYKFFQGAEQSEAEDRVNPTYRFLHDRVQQAAYSLIPEDQRQATHLLIARLLRQNTPDAEIEANVFEIVSHWNSAIALVIDPAEKINLAQLNLIAGRKAKASTAYEPALQYFQTGLTLLSEGWQRQPLLMLALQSGAAETAYLCGNLAQMEQWVSEILAQKLNPLDCVKAYEIQIQAYTSQSRYYEAIAIARTALKPFNIHLPEQPTPADIAPARQEVAELLNGRTAAELLDLPVMTAAEPLAVMQLLSSITVTAYISAPLLYPFVVLSQVKLSIQHGNSTLSAFGYSHYATLSSILEYLDVAYEFGQLGLQLVAKFNARTILAKVNFIVGVGIIHCKSHFRGSLPLFMEAFQVGLEVGDLEFAGYSLQNLCQCAYWIGKNLTTLVAETETYVATLRKLNRTTSSNYSHLVLDSIQRLQGNQSQPALAASSEQLHTALTTAKDLLGLHYYWIYQLTTSYLLNETTQAMQAAVQARQTLAAGGYLITVRFFYFYDSLTALAADAEAADKNVLLERVTANQAKLQHRAYHAPMNFQHKYDLVEAEQHRFLGNKAEAIEFYDKAISGAKVNGYIQEEALANELAAKFYLNWGKEKIAQDYLIHAYYGYAHWGAKAKVQDLEQRYPKLLAPVLQQQRTSLSVTETVSASVYLTIGTQSSTSDSTSISATLDLATVLKASQTLSSEIQLDKLLATLLHTVLENAGADKGALLMPRQQQWFVEAVATLDQPVRVQSIALSHSPEIPHTLINIVKRNLQPVVIVDTSVHPTLSTDAYIVQQQPQSLLCTPILHQGKLVAILYLENHVTAGAFTSDRVQLLNFLCTQAAISLENARLYQQSQQAEVALQEREQFLSSIYDGAEMCIFVMDVSSDGNFRYAGWNTLAERVFGIRNADVVGKTSIEVFGVDQGESMKQWLAGCVKAGTFIYAEQYIPIEGQDSWWFATLNPLKNEQGQVYRIIGTAFDVSDRKRAEAVTTQKSQELEQALQDLQNTQLQMVQSEKMASLGNLVAGVAHEINNPIGFLNGSINNAKDYVQDILGHLALYQQHHPNAAAPVQENAQDIDLEFLSEDMPKLLDSMQGATDRIKSISTSLRTFSRADTEHKVSANLHEGIDSTLLILKYRLKANEHRPAIQLIQDYGQLSTIECFPGQLNQVFINILANAIDVFDEAAQQSAFADLQANPQKITIQTVLTPQNAVEIRIGDNGKGMSFEVKARIFDHLFTTKAVGKGTGLGLAIARQIVVEKHGGSLDVQSELGQGTEFCIHLPIRVHISS
ncbi:ATP-binding sensor histidine kinase [Nostoc sp.]|uniref:ATP-binding sensor histidine kinase n=1 Tax=Nostoc sp. TaxID=1180 RepID=UPI002FF5667C